MVSDRYAAVFIGGGNTFKLLAEVMTSGFDEQLHIYLSGGGFLYGGSAGAILCGMTIESAAHADANDVGLADLSGLNLFDGYDIWCHYAPEDDPLIAAYPRKLYILYEESGLLLENEAMRKIGKPYRQRA